MSMREKLAKALTLRETEFGRQMTPVEAAQGAVAALPECIKPLIWNEARHGGCESGQYWVAQDDGDEAAFWSWGFGSDVLGNCAERADCQAAAEEHHRAAIMSAFGVEVKA